MWYKKHGGLHWLAIGRLRLSWCIKAKSQTKAAPGYIYNSTKPVKIPGFIVYR